MATGTKYALAEALKKMMSVKPIDKITVKDLVEICGVNRQTFYYHFDDVYDLLFWIFEQDANKILPESFVYENWQDDVIRFINHLNENSTYVLNVYNSNRRLQMLQYIKDKVKPYIAKYAETSEASQNISAQDYEFVIDFCADAVAAIAARWMDKGMSLPEGVNEQRFLRVLDNCVENLLERFEN